MMLRTKVSSVPRHFFAVWPWGIGLLAMMVMGGLAGSRPAAAQTAAEDRLRRAGPAVVAGVGIVRLRR